MIENSRNKIEVKKEHVYLGVIYHEETQKFLVIQNGMVMSICDKSATALLEAASSIDALLGIPR